jgi:hypothetical protein
MLRTCLQGSVLLPEDEGYDKAHQTWEAKTFDQHPAVIFLPARASDVQVAVSFFRAKWRLRKHQRFLHDEGASK